MADLADLTESALDAIAEGVALADMEGRIACWSSAAETITGYCRAETVGHRVREVLETLIVGGRRHWAGQTNSHTETEPASLVHIRHKEGHELPVLARIIVLRDGLGERIGMGVMFHPVQSIDALPHGEAGEDARVDDGPSEIEERLEGMHQDFVRGDSPLGVLWVTVDQARGLRRTHGARAYEAMLEKMQRTLTTGLKPVEEIGRWGDDEFLVVSHERSAAMLAARAQMLTGMARTTDFRWWGDRISLTVSIGAAQAERGESVSAMLERAEAAMLASIRAGGNQVTSISRRNTCSPSWASWLFLAR